MDHQAIVAGLRLFAHGKTTEIRLLGVLRGESVVSGYYDTDHYEDAARDIGRYASRASGVYMVLNEIDQKLLARSANRLKEYAKPTTADHDVLRRKWLYIDIDPKRPTGISSTDEEHALSCYVGKDILRYLQDELVVSDASIVFIDSGNGARVQIAIDLPNDDESLTLIQRCLQGLAHRFNTDQVQVDLTTFNAARIARIPGTRAGKGDSTPDRPHRLCRMIRCPEIVTPVGIEVLEQIAALLPEPEKAQKETKTGQTMGDLSGTPAEIGLKWLEAWCKKFGLSPKSAVSYMQGYKLQVDCPFNADHKIPDAALYVSSEGKFGFKCSHNSCDGKNWKMLRASLDEGYRNRKSGEGQSDGPDNSDSGGSSNTHTNTEKKTPEWSAVRLQKLEAELSPVLPLTPDMLPSRFRDWVLDAADRGGFPVEYVAVSLLAGFGAAVGRRACIRPKKHDTWTVIPNTYGAIVGPPSALKSPSAKEAIAPLLQLEAEAGEAYKNRLREWEASELIRQAEQKAAKSQLEKAAKNPNTTAEEKKELARQAMGGAAEDKPTCERFVANDATVEKLHELLQQNPNGLFVFRDELTGFFRSLDKQGRETDRAFFLEAWNGSNRFTVDRIQRGTVTVDHLCLSLFGTIQPGPLASYLRKAGEGDEADGFIPRLQLLVWPDSRPFKLVDRPVNERAKAQVRTVFTRAVNLTMEVLGAQEVADGVPVLRFDEEAQREFFAWWEALEARLRSGTLTPLMEMHLGKYRSLMPTLALLFHIADGGCGQVTLSAAQMAIRWCGFLESHARRIYQYALDGSIETAAHLVERIRQSLQDGFTVRDVWKKGWAGLTTADDVEKACGLLEDRGWLQGIEERNEAGGRPTTRWYVNPDVYTGNFEGGATEAPQADETVEPIEEDTEPEGFTDEWDDPFANGGEA